MADGHDNPAENRPGHGSQDGPPETTTSSDSPARSSDELDEKKAVSGDEAGEAGESAAGAEHRKDEADNKNGDEEEEEEEEPPEDDDMPPLANEPSAGFQAFEIQQMQSHTRRPPSTLSRVPTVVPRSKRRGLFGQLALLPEVEKPYEYPNKTKWLITLIIALSGAGGPMGSSILYPALTELASDMHVTSTVTNLTIAMYMLAMAIFPLWWSSFSETFGRRSIYIVSFSLFVVFSALSAISSSIGMLVVMRVFGGGASASVQAVGAGTLADIWKPHERGRAMGIFYLGPLCGPLLSPIIGGALAEAWGWRSTMWFLTIYGGVVVIMIFFCLPETLSKHRHPAGHPTGHPTGHPPASPPSGDAAQPPLTRMTTAQSVRVKTHRMATFLHHAFVHPLSVLVYLRFPPIVLTVVYGAVTFGALFVLNVSVQSAYSSPPYNFGEIIVGLLYVPGSLGYILASMLGGRWIDRIMTREARRAGRYDEHGQLVLLPEDRMRENAWLSASLFPAAMIWFGWTIQNGVFWLVPALANFFFGIGSMLVFGAVTTMLTEFMPRRSSGGIALNNLLRNIFSCVGVIVTQPLIDAMGFGWLCTMVALGSWVVGNACIWALRRYSAKWRVMMDAELNKLS